MPVLYIPDKAHRAPGVGRLTGLQCWTVCMHWCRFLSSFDYGVGGQLGDAEGLGGKLKGGDRKAILGVGGEAEQGAGDCITSLLCPMPQDRTWIQLFGTSTLVI